MEEDDEGVRIAIAALGSLKTGSTTSTSTASAESATAKGKGKGREGPHSAHEIVDGHGPAGFRPSMWVTEQRGWGEEGLTATALPSVQAAQDSSSPSSAAANAASDGPPPDAHHGSSGVGCNAGSSSASLSYSPVSTPSALTATTESSSPSSPSQAWGAERPPYTTRYVRVGEDGLYTPGTSASDGASTFYDLTPGASLQQSTSNGEDGFIGRVAQMPLVSGALKVYERGKQSSRVVKYGTDLVESSVKTVSKPVINRVIGPGLVGQLDDFACRQLDRFGSRTGGSPRGAAEVALPSEQQLQLQQQQQQHEHQTLLSSRSTSSYFPSPEDYYRRPQGRGRAFPADTEGTEQDDVSISPTSETPTLGSQYSSAVSAHFSEDQGTQRQMVRASSASRSRWQNLVIEAGVTAGGIGAAVSEESMKSLKYCLHWLHYATAHLDHQVGILREFILSLTSPHLRRTPAGALVRSEDVQAASILDGIKRDVMETIKKVVDVVSTYAGSALPEQAKRYVRNSILALPDKWAKAMSSTGDAAAIEADAGASASAEHLAGEDAGGRQPRPTVLRSPTHAAAEHMLVFAVESLDMLRSMLNIFNDSVERADAWVERLRVVGLQRQQALSAPQRQLREGHALRSPVGRNSLEQSAGQSSGLKRREGQDGEMSQRRKNSRTALHQTACTDATPSGATDMETD